jgi:hypothetical protein
MFERLINSMLGASAATVAPSAGAVLVSPTVAWIAIVSVLAFAAVALWFLREARVEDPQKPTSYREAA